MFECVLAVLLLVTATSQAKAYIDPGAGTMILQGLIATVAGGLLALKAYGRRLREWLISRRGKSPES